LAFEVGGTHSVVTTKFKELRIRSYLKENTPQLCCDRNLKNAVYE
jgi:hypothetical protein